MSVVQPYDIRSIFHYTMQLGFQIKGNNSMGLRTKETQSHNEKFVLIISEGLLLYLGQIQIPHRL